MILQQFNPPLYQYHITNQQLNLHYQHYPTLQLVNFSPHNQQTRYKQQQTALTLLRSHTSSLAALPVRQEGVLIQPSEGALQLARGIRQIVEEARKTID